MSCTWPSRERGPGLDDFVSRRQDGDGRPVEDVHCGRAHRGNCADPAWCQHVAGRDDRPAGHDVRTSTADVLSRANCRDHADVFAVLRRVFDHDDRGGAGGEWGAGRNLHAFAGRDSARRHVAREDAADKSKGARRRRRGAGGVVGDNGVAVHRCSIEGGYIMSRRDIARAHASICV